MTISTMAAAALGNTISDVLGIGSAVYVERIVEMIGVKPPDLTPVQLEMKSARRASNIVRINFPFNHVENIYTNILFSSLTLGSCIGNYNWMSTGHVTFTIF